MSPYLGCKVAAITQAEDPFMKQLLGVNQQVIVFYRGTPQQSLKVYFSRSRSPPLSRQGYNRYHGIIVVLWTK